MSDHPRLAVGPGGGRVARRDRALLYLPEGASSEVLERFRRSEHDALAKALTGHVLAARDAVPAFVFIQWPAGADETHVHVIVRGDVEVFSDLESMPSLSGADSATWVEHRFLRGPDAATFRCGAPVDADTDLSDGVVAGGGFELLFAHHTQGDLAESGRRLDRIASLEAAGGGDWMEESLQLGDVAGPRDDRPSTAPATAPAVELPDGTRHSVGGILVLGRQPDAAAARAPGAAVISLAAAASVSRTHLRLSLDGPKLFATDCSSSGGTVLTPAGDRESIHLRPWMAHEVGNGDRLHLGGVETCLVIHDSRDVEQQAP